MPTVDTNRLKLKPTIVNTFIKNELSFSNIVICQLIIFLNYDYSSSYKSPTTPKSRKSIIIALQFHSGNIFSNHSGKEKAHHRNKPASASFANTRRSHTKRPNAKSGKSRLCRRTHTHNHTPPSRFFRTHNVREIRRPTTMTRRHKYRHKSTNLRNWCQPRTK